MSLPDTLFIFVLALIIFGPKKLPEIGRQIGKLVGEFRRASNEFKFQIEEELRQADFAEKPAPLPTIGAPAATTVPSIEAAVPVDLSLPATETPDPRDPAINLAVSEYPGIDVDPPAVATDFAAPSIVEIPFAAPAPDITPAAGSEPRITLPLAASTPAPDTPGPHPAPAEAEITHG